MAKPKIETALLTYETKLWNAGHQVVVGVDEVGRGPLAGPVVVAAVAFLAFHDRIEGVYDSKSRSSVQRESLAEKIAKNASFVAIGEASPLEIDNRGITAAVALAADRALSRMLQETDIDHLLVDGNQHNIKLNQDTFPHEKITYITKGDQQVYSIAAASIVAKVSRDVVMQQLAQDKSNSVYGWQTNVGYGTKEHRQALLKHGPSNHHRLTFIQKILRKR